MTSIAYSYSSIKQFQNCPRQYHETKILKRAKSQPTEATRYGELVHTAFENYVKDNTPLPEAFKNYQHFVEPLTRLTGEIQCELKLAIRKDFTPCEFFASDVWFRGLPDLLAINRQTGVARVVDYKTGKSSRYADTTQLELMAAMVMCHYPEIHTVKGVLLFVVANDIIKAEFTRAQLPTILSKWAGYAGNVEDALENGVWNPKASGLCKFCPVSEATCEYR
jgi:CRISPR/Cas system-associated exonuclease Cas4 (RecB family)